MLIDECRPTDEVFTHIDEDTKQVRHFNASAMVRAVPQLLATGEVVRIEVAMEAEFIEFIKHRRGVDVERAVHMGMDVLRQPVIGVALPDNFVLTVDGHHRLTGLAAAGETTYYMYLFSPDAWPPFLITNFSEAFSDFLVQDTLADAVAKG